MNRFDKEVKIRSTHEDENINMSVSSIFVAVSTGVKGLLKLDIQSFFCHI